LTTKRRKSKYFRGRSQKKGDEKGRELHLLKESLYFLFVEKINKKVEMGVLL
jgi:hypothetical protein